MDLFELVAWLVVMGVFVGALYLMKANAREAGRQEAVRRQKQRALICPHCQTKGSVTTKQVRIKGSVSGAKATGALLTGGLSLLATGLSRKQNVTEASCSNCGSIWHFE